MNDQANVPALAAMTCPDNSLMDNNGIGPSFHYFRDRGLHIHEPGYRTDSYAMIERHNYRAAILAVHNTFHSNLLPDHFYASCFNRLLKQLQTMGSIVSKQNPRRDLLYYIGHIIDTTASNS
jgi:hypothetical protein